MNPLRKIVMGIRNLKPLPQVVNKIMAITGDPEGSVEDLAALISHDPMVTANILKAANAAYYGRAGKFDSVHQAVVFLGMDEIVDLVLLTSSADNLKRAHRGYGLESGELWHCAVASAMLARKIAVQQHLPDPHLVFTAALLKDIGKVVLAQHVAESCNQIQSLVQTGRYSFREAEKEVLGIDHAELGALVCRIWQFSSRMTDIIANHHQPDQATEAVKETAVVYLSDMLCMMMGMCGGTDGLAYRFKTGVIKELGMTETDLQLMIAAFSEQASEMESLIGMT